MANKKMTKEERQEIAILADDTSDAYSFNRYGKRNWLNACIMLAGRGLNAVEIDAVMRSKWTRWASDNSGNEHGNVTADDLANWLDENAPNLKASIRENLL